MQVTPHVYRCNISGEMDPAAMHPGGSGIYFVGDPAQEMVVVDSGQPYRSWTKKILDFYQELGRPKISAILITHGHGDHTGGLDRLQEKMGGVVRCHPKLVSRLALALDDRTVVKLSSRELIRTGGGMTLRALFTPGHEVDHVCYYLAQERVMFTGDTILGASSSTVHSLSEYMKSLQLLARYRPAILCPAHGPVVPDGTRRVQWYIDHRMEREEQVLAALQKGLNTVEEMVKDIYPRNLRRALRQAAGRNVITHLGKLMDEGRVSSSDITYALKRV